MPLPLDNLFDELFPLLRSIAGPGFRESLDILRRYIPLEVQSIPSGKQVFDWEVPPEWHIREAKLTGPDSKVYASLGETNLSVVNYSAPVDSRLSLDELRPHLHTLPHLPDAIPYVTGYYKRDWGFCLPHRVYEGLPEGEYHAFIDSEFVAGELNYGELLLPGETDREILLTSYLCHPSLANNELSGPLALALLYERISAWPRRRYGYRFLLNPETIGSLAYLSRCGDHLRERLESGLVLTCLGGPAPRMSYKMTRHGDALIDITVEHLISAGAMDIDIREFTPVNGSDERQYCSPGFNLPVGQMARTVYAQYDGYHNSLDTKEFMGIDTLIDSTDAIEKLLNAMEYSGYFVNLRPFGEPQLGKRGLYPNVNDYEVMVKSSDTVIDDRTALDRILTILNYADGERPMAWIAEKCECSILNLIPIIDRLEGEGLLALRGSKL